MNNNRTPVLCQARFLSKWLQRLYPGAAAHPEVHPKREEQHDGNRDRKYLPVRPADKVRHRLEEIHAEKAGDEGDGHEEGGDDRQGLHYVIHTVVDHGKVGVQRTADEVAQAFVQVMQADEMVVNIPEEDENKILHIGLPIGKDDVLMASDSLESLGQKLAQGNNVYISVHPESKEEADRIFNALSAGGTIEMPIADQPWGDYYGSFKDKFGVLWMVNYSYPKAE